MSWIDRGTTKALFGLILAATSGAALADALVVRSTGPSAASYKPGTPIAASARILLKAGDTLTILDGQGTRKLVGPGSFSPNAPAGTGVSSTRLTALTALPNQRRERIGAVRGATGPINNTNVWNLDTGKPGSFCIGGPAAIQLYRADSSAAGTTRISGPGLQQTVTWAEGVGVAKLPAGAQVEPGKSYTLTTSGGAPVTISVKSIDVKLLDPILPDLGDIASKLITNGCDAQLDVLVRSVALPADQAG